MIPQPFVKGGGERVFFGPYEYPAGADLIYDFGNPLCTSEFDSGRIVYNIGSANVTASLIPYNNPGPFYPTLSTDNGGTAVFVQQALTTGSFMQWDWKSTENQTNIFIYKPNVSQTGEMGFPISAGANSLFVKITQNNLVYAGVYDSSNVLYDDLFGGPQLNTGSLNGRNGWNALTMTANASTTHQLYINASSPIVNNTNITRITSGTQTTSFPNPTVSYGITANNSIMAFLQYPKILTPKEIRQINKVFAPRYYT